MKILLLSLGIAALILIGLFSFLAYKYFVKVSVFRYHESKGFNREPELREARAGFYGSIVAVLLLFSLATLIVIEIIYNYGFGLK